MEIGDGNRIFSIFLPIKPSLIAKKLVGADFILNSF